MGERMVGLEMSGLWLTALGAQQHNFNCLISPLKILTVLNSRWDRVVDFNDELSHHFLTERDVGQYTFQLDSQALWLLNACCVYYLKR